MKAIACVEEVNRPADHGVHHRDQQDRNDKRQHGIRDVQVVQGTVNKTQHERNQLSAVLTLTLNTVKLSLKTQSYMSKIGSNDS